MFLFSLFLSLSSKRWKVHSFDNKRLLLARSYVEIKTRYYPATFRIVHLRGLFSFSSDSLRSLFNNRRSSSITRKMIPGWRRRVSMTEDYVAMANQIPDWSDKSYFVLSNHSRRLSRDYILPKVPLRWDSIMAHSRHSATFNNSRYKTCVYVKKNKCDAT